MFKSDFNFKNFKSLTKLMKEQTEESQQQYEEQFDSTGKLQKDFNNFFLF